MSRDKYPSIFLHQMETIVYILITAGVTTYFILVQLSGKLCGVLCHLIITWIHYCTCYSISLIMIIKLRGWCNDELIKNLIFKVPVDL